SCTCTPFEDSGRATQSFQLLPNHARSFSPKPTMPGLPILLVLSSQTADSGVLGIGRRRKSFANSKTQAGPKLLSEKGTVPLPSRQMHDSSFKAEGDSPLFGQPQSGSGRGKWLPRFRCPCRKATEAHRSRGTRFGSPIIRRFR